MDKEKIHTIKDQNAQFIQVLSVTRDDKSYSKMRISIGLSWEDASAEYPTLYYELQDHPKKFKNKQEV